MLRQAIWFGSVIAEGSGFKGARGGDALVRPMLVVEVLELAEGVEPVPLVPDQRVGFHYPVALSDLRRCGRLVRTRPTADTH
ncbi:hypothetical protein [Actinomadura sp. 9N407]|uniref:hypothetical protein n=1 Tax=Actinomadura sp. 9N407 TaxID=3375154 RepID=UPI00378D8883